MERAAGIPRQPLDELPEGRQLPVVCRARRLLGLGQVRHQPGERQARRAAEPIHQPGGRYENRNLEISAITRSFKQLAKELDIPVVLLSQLSRQPERRGGDHRPQLADLRESGAIEQDADMVLFVYRDIVYNDAADPREAELIIAKNRNGETGSVPLVFFGEQSRFLSRAAPGHHEAPFA